MLDRKELMRILESEQGVETTAAPSSEATARTLDGTDSDAASEAHARYEEYLRELDELPTLYDVISEPPRIVVRDFRLGERPDARKDAREDAYALREKHALDLEQQYCEYVEAIPKRAGAVERGRARKSAAKKGRSKRSKRSKRRKG